MPWQQAWKMVLMYHKRKWGNKFSCIIKVATLTTWQLHNAQFLTIKEDN